LIQLRVPDGIDVEFLGTFNTHLVPKNAVNDRGSRVIGDFWSKAIICICLFPHSAVLQTDHGSASIVDEKDAERAAQLIHAEFGLGRLLPAPSATQPLA